MNISPESIQLTFLEAGHGTVKADGRGERRDGWTQHKVVPYTTLAQAIEGAYEVQTGDGRHAHIRTGEAFMVARDIPLAVTHHCDPKSGLMRVRYVHFNVRVFDAVNLAWIASFPFIVPAVWANRFGDIADRIDELQNLQPPGIITPPARIHAMGFRLLAMLLDYMEETGIITDIRPGMARLMPVLNRINRNPAAKVTGTDLAQLASLSVPRFYAEFKKATGMAPLEYVRRIRLNRVCEMLRTDQRGLDEIATATGFCNAYHLNRDFKKMYGMPPGAYRKRFAAMMVM